MSKEKNEAPNGYEPTRGNEFVDRNKNTKNTSNSNDTRAGNADKKFSNNTSPGAEPKYFLKKRENPTAHSDTRNESYRILLESGKKQKQELQYILAVEAIRKSRSPELLGASNIEICKASKPFTGTGFPIIDSSGGRCANNLVQKGILVIADKRPCSIRKKRVNHYALGEGVIISDTTLKEITEQIPTTSEANTIILSDNQVNKFHIPSTNDTSGSQESLFNGNRLAKKESEGLDG